VTAPRPRRLALWRRVVVCLIDFMVGEYDRLDADWHLLDPDFSGQQVENATISIKFSPELLEDLKTWSEPVQLRAERDPNDEWTLIVRLVKAQSAERLFHEIMDATGWRLRS
jgi:hypothetical protein